MEPAEGVRDLLEAAREAREHAYCPYSGYAVGAAVKLIDGSVATGCNVENVSFGTTMCAERNAIAAAVLLSSDAPGITAIAIVAAPLAESSITSTEVLPCGACLQVIAEFGGSRTRIVCARADALDDPQVYTLGELLPHRFGDR